MKDFSLKQLLHDAVRNEPKKEYHGIHCSGIAGCPRTMYWHIKGVEETTPPNVGALMNFKMGYAWEHTLFPLLDGLEGIDVHHHKDDKVWGDEELNLYGTPDFTLTVDGKNVIVDSKTVNSAWFKYTEREYKKVEQHMSKQDFLLAKNHHYELQQGAYLLLAKRMGLEYDHARLVFVSKDDSFVGWEVKIYLTPELEKEIIDKCNYINKCLKEDTLPECTCEGWQVGYCNYGDKSTQEPNSKKKIVNTSCCSEEIK